MLKAEQEARERKRKAVGGAFVGLDAPVAEIEDRNPEEIERRKLCPDDSVQKKRETAARKVYGRYIFLDDLCLHLQQEFAHDH